MFRPSFSHPSDVPPPHRHPPHPPPPPPHGHLPHVPHPPVMRTEEAQPTPPLLTERDRELLGKLLENEDEAQRLFHLLQNSPSEIAALGHLILRVFERNHPS